MFYLWKVFTRIIANNDTRSLKSRERQEKKFKNTNDELSRKKKIIKNVSRMRSRIVKIYETIFWYI